MDMTQISSTSTPFSHFDLYKLPHPARLFLHLLKKIQFGHITLITPCKHTLYFGDHQDSAGVALQIHDWRVCKKIIRGGDIGFAECYAQGLISTNNLTLLLKIVLRNESLLEPAIFGGQLMNLWYRLKHWLRPNTKSGSKKNIHAHYDLGNDFYALWLDKTWTYSSAIFDGDFNMDLEKAQYRKYQRIIDTLQLQAGDHVLEIGCGWGGFAEHAAQQGIYVDGITISPSQLHIAQARFDGKPYAALVNLRLMDYRDIQKEYHAIVSIEMFEAVGEKFWPTYFQTLTRSLKPRGKALIQSITIDESRFEKYRSGSDFIQQYIFPGGMLPSIPRFVEYAKKNQLHTQDVYTFGSDYAETLRRWNHLFHTHIENVKQIGFDEKFQRIWHLYLAYCEAGFDEKRIDVAQILLQKQG